MTGMPNKEMIANRLAQAHFAIEPEIREIIRVVSSPDREADPTEPIKLLEANENTTATGIRPIFFGPDLAAGIPFASVIIEVTPEELREIRDGRMRLPNGWRVDGAFARTAVGVVG